MFHLLSGEGRYRNSGFMVEFFFIYYNFIISEFRLFFYFYNVLVYLPKNILFFLAVSGKGEVDLMK